MQDLFVRKLACLFIPQLFLVAYLNLSRIIVLNISTGTALNHNNSKHFRTPVRSIFVAVALYKHVTSARISTVFKTVK